jgi:hypothetical protein
MAFTIRRVEYYYVNVRDELGAAYRVLSQLAELGVDLLAFTAVPSGPSRAHFTLFPEDPGKLVIVVELLNLPPRVEVIRDARKLVPTSTARDVGQYLDAGMARLRQSSEQFFVGEMVLLRHYNRAKHGTSMVRLEEHTNDEFDFQLIAPEWRLT